MDYELFTSKNWDAKTLSNMLHEQLLLSKYESNIPHPLADQVSADKYDSIYNAIIDAFLQSRGDDATYREAIADGLISHYKRASESNEDIYNDNVEKIKRFAEYIVMSAQNRVDNGRDFR